MRNVLQQLNRLGSRQRVEITLAVVIVALAGWFVHGARTQPKANRDLAPLAAESVRTKTLTIVTSPQFSEFTGSVRPELESTLSARLSGLVRQVMVHEGDRVQRGQILVTLDARDLDASVAEASASLRSATVVYDTAKVAARMESSLSEARISEARAKVTQSQAALGAAAAKLDVVLAGPRPQERNQAAQEAAQALSAYNLAESSLKRMADLFREGAISAQQNDQYVSQRDTAKARYESALQAQSIADEGSRSQDIRAATAAEKQAKAAVQEAEAGLRTAQASAMQTQVRLQEIKGATAQIGQSRASLTAAKTTRDFAIITAPFHGIVTRRFADPGTMAAPGVPLIAVQGGALRLEAVVAESALSNISIGRSIEITVDALGRQTMLGKIVEVAPQGDPTSHSFVVKVALPAGTGASPGMFGRIRIRMGTSRMLLAPLSAVFEREGISYLFVVDETVHARLRLVTVGAELVGAVPILSGANPGERIITSRLDKITDGALVREER